MNMYTAPDFRQKGVGSRILALLLAFAKEAGAKRVWLHSEPQARKLYERAGFVPKTSEMEMPSLRWAGTPCFSDSNDWRYQAFTYFENLHPLRCES